MGKRKKESPFCSSPHNIAGGGLRREPYELRSMASRTRSGRFIRVRRASTPSKIPNLEGDSSLQVRPAPEKIKNEKKDSMTESLNDPPAPPIPNQTLYPRLDPETLGIGYFDAFRRAIGAVMDHLAAGGTDVERIKREVGVTDEPLRRYNHSTNLEEYRQNCLRIATPLFPSCAAKLNQTNNQADDLELLDVLFIEGDVPHGVTRVHMHFRAMCKSKADTGHEPPGLYCAVLYPLGAGEYHVVGCVLLENYCPGGSNGGTLGNCLDAANRNAKTLADLLALPDEVDYGEIKRRIRELRIKSEKIRKGKEEMSRCLIR